MFYKPKNDPDLRNPNFKLLEAQGYYFLPVVDGSCTVIARDGAPVWRIVADLFRLDLCWHYTYLEADRKRIYKFSCVPAEGQTADELRDRLQNNLSGDPVGSANLFSVRTRQAAH
jgi:hypothetical protein